MRLLVFRKPLALRLAIGTLLLILSRIVLVICVSTKPNRSHAERSYVGLFFQVPALFVHIPYQSLGAITSSRSASLKP